jgi:transketolase
MRTRFIQTLAQLAAEDPRITLIVGDLGYSVVEDFAKRYPGQFWNAGVAEQDMTGIATGLAMAGRVVFTYSIANFATLRCLEQIRNDVCYHRASVKIVAVGCGYAYGAHGYTHHGLEDLGILRTLPGMAVATPADPLECEETVRLLARTPGPAYLRLGKNKEPLLHSEPLRLEMGRLLPLRAGSDAAIFASGPILAEALGAADRLRLRGIDAGVVSVPWLKPFDRDTVLEIARRTPLLVSVEEHGPYGGLGSALAEVLAETGSPARLLRRHAMEDFDAIGSQDYLRRLAGLDAASIAEAVEAALRLPASAGAAAANASEPLRK